MGALVFDDLPEQALLLLDAAPVIYYVEDTGKFAERFEPLFAAQSSGRLRFALTPITIAEVLTGPLRAGDETLARRYRSLLDTWQLIATGAEIAEGAARLRATARLKLPDAIQAASALAVGAAALVTHDRDFSRLKGLRVIS